MSSDGFCQQSEFEPESGDHTLLVIFDSLFLICLFDFLFKLFLGEEKKYLRWEKKFQKALQINIL